MKPPRELILAMYAKEDGAQLVLSNWLREQGDDRLADWVLARHQAIWPAVGWLVWHERRPKCKAMPRIDHPDGRPWQWFGNQWNDYGSSHWKEIPTALPWCVFEHLAEPGFFTNYDFAMRMAAHAVTDAIRADPEILLI